VSKRQGLAIRLYNINAQQQPPVMGLLDTDSDGRCSTIIQYRLESAFSVLRGQAPDTGLILFTTQGVEQRAQFRVSPIAAQRGHQSEIDGIGKRIDPLAGCVAIGWVYACVHSRQFSLHRPERVFPVDVNLHSHYCSGEGFGLLPWTCWL